MSKTEELDLRVAGPEERDAVVEGAGAAVDEAAWRLAGMVMELSGFRDVCAFLKGIYGGLEPLHSKAMFLEKIGGCLEKQWRGVEDPLGYQ